MRNDLSLRPETPQDDPFLFDLYATTRDYEMIHVPWDDLQKQLFLHQQCDAQLKHYRSAFSDADFKIILLSGERIGRLYVLRAPKEIRLIDISLLREYRGTGIGTELTMSLLKEAETSQKSVTLHVEHMNPARRLYERLGFKLAEDKGIYWLMEWKPGSGKATSSS